MLVQSNEDGQEELYSYPCFFYLLDAGLEKRHIPCKEAVVAGTSELIAISELADE